MKKSKRNLITERKISIIERLYSKLYLLLKEKFFQRWLFYLILLIALPTIFLFLKTSLLFPDAVGYFTYTSSLVMDRDLLIKNNLIQCGIRDNSKYFHPTQNDYISSPFAIGTSLAWIPFFLIVHLIVIILKIFLNIPSEYLHPYTLACSLGSCVYGLFSLLISYKITRRFFSNKDTLLALLGIWFASPFFFCFYWMPTHSHLLDAFAISLFLLMWISSKDKESLLFWICFGLSFGFAVLVRWQNIILGILLLFPPKISLRSLILYPLFLLSSLLAFSFQLITWKIIYGKFFLIPQGESYMRWNNPEILNVLFSSWHGLYSWTPILIFSTIGILLFYRNDKRIAIGFFLIFLIQIYVNSCIEDWWGGLSFGARRIIGLSPIFLIGLASFFSLFSKWKEIIKYLILLLSLFFVFILTLSMLNTPDYLAEYRSYQELIQINLNTVLSFKKMLPAITSFGLLEELNSVKAISPSFTIVLKIIYSILGILFFFILKIGYEIIMKLKP